MLSVGLVPVNPQALHGGSIPNSNEVEAHAYAELAGVITERKFPLHVPAKQVTETVKLKAYEAARIRLSPRGIVMFQFAELKWMPDSKSTLP